MFSILDRYLGKEKRITTSSYRKINSVMTSTLESNGTTEVASYLTEVSVKRCDTRWKIRQSIEAIDATLYNFNQLKSDMTSSRRPLRKCVFSVSGRGQLMEGEQAVREGMAISSGIHLAKDLGNLPGNICTPSYLAKQSRRIEQLYQNLKVNGSSQQRSPLVVPALSKSLISGLWLPSKPAGCAPSATTQAPVRVAISITTSGLYFSA